MTKEIFDLISTAQPCIYIVSDDEIRLIKQINKNFTEVFNIKVFRTTTGICNCNDYLNSLKNVVSDTKQPIPQFINVLNDILVTKNSDSKGDIYILLDVENNFSENNPSSSQYSRKLKDIIQQIQCEQSNLKILVIISSNLNIPNKLQRYVEVVYDQPPTYDEINKFIEVYLKKYNSTSIQNKIKNCNEFSYALKGLTFYEIERIIVSSIYYNDALNLNQINKFKKSILNKTTLLDIIDTDIDLDNVGGMSKLKNWLDKRKGFLTDDGKKLNLPLLKGLLLIGITGCGKSYISKAIAKSWALPLISLNTSKLFSQRVGQSESNMLQALKLVEAMSPCILFIDEIEKSFAGSQSSTFSDAGTTARVIGNFLTWYQEHTSQVFVVATCNNVQYLPSELISRFDDKFFVNIPSLKERQKIFEIQLNNYGYDWKKLNISLFNLAENSKQLTGREIEQVVKSSIFEMYHEQKSDENVKLNEQHILTVLKNKIPILKTMEDDIKYLIQWVGWDDEKKDGIRANYANVRDEDESDDINKLLSDVLNSDVNYLDKQKKR